MINDQFVEILEKLIMDVQKNPEEESNVLLFKNSGKAEALILKKVLDLYYRLHIKSDNQSGAV